MDKLFSLLIIIFNNSLNQGNLTKFLQIWRYKLTQVICHLGDCASGLLWAEFRAQLDTIEV